MNMCYNFSMIDFYWGYFFASVIGCVVSLLFSTRPKRYVLQNESEWLDISEFPIPDKYFESGNYDVIYVSDGKTIRDYATITCNNRGVPMLGYPKKPIKYWKPMPKLPMENI